MKALLALLAMTATLHAAEPEKSDRMLVFVGTYTGGNSRGIYACEFSAKGGTLKSIGLAAETPSPSFLAIHPNKKFLYAVNEVSEYGGQKAGSVTGFSIDPKGKLTKINDATSGGPGPCYVTVDRTGNYVLLANYGGGSIESLPIDEKGKLGKPIDFIQHNGSSVNKQRQSEPHAHSINLDPNNKFALVADLGLDKILVYSLDARNGQLKPNDPPFAATVPGGGPRHLSFRPDGNSLFVNNEMLSSVTSFAYNQKAGTLKQGETISTLPADWKGNNSTAQIQVHPTGKYVYCSNRGHNSIAAFSIGSDGKLKLIEIESSKGKTPRNFEIDPTGTYLIAANQDSDSLAVFRIMPNTGELEQLGDLVSVPKPVCVKFLALDK